MHEKVSLTFFVWLDVNLPIGCWMESEKDWVWSHIERSYKQGCRRAGKPRKERNHCLLGRSPERPCWCLPIRIVIRNWSLEQWVKWEIGNCSFWAEQVRHLETPRSCHWLQVSFSLIIYLIVFYPCRSLLNYATNLLQKLLPQKESLTPLTYKSWSALMPRGRLMGSSLKMPSCMRTNHLLPFGAGKLPTQHFYLNIYREV